MAIRFFFEYKNELIQLPVNPESIAIETPGKNQTAEVVKIGEINILRTAGLTECTIESFLPVDSTAPYVLTTGDFKEPEFYIKFFNKIRADKKPARFIISDVGINMMVSIENFDYNLQAQDDDTYYTIEIKQYKTYDSKVLKVNTTTKKVTKKKGTTKERQKTRFAIGDTVIVTGNYWYDSYGSNPHGTFKNFQGKISHIVADKTRKYRYHITTPSGGYRGWVSESQLSHK